MSWARRSLQPRINPSTIVPLQHIANISSLGSLQPSVFDQIVCRKSQSVPHRCAARHRHGPNSHQSRLYPHSIRCGHHKVVPLWSAHILPVIQIMVRVQKNLGATTDIKSSPQCPVGKCNGMHRASQNARRTIKQEQSLYSNQSQQRCAPNLSFPCPLSSSALLKGAGTGHRAHNRKAMAIDG